MNYRVEYYKNTQRCNEQYADIHAFLEKAGEQKKNEHYHWGRFEWMHTHSFLEEDKLTTIAVIKDENNQIQGLISYDTCYDDRSYLVHISDDDALLNVMVDTVIKDEKQEINFKVNSEDVALEKLLSDRGFVKKNLDFTMLELKLDKALEYEIPTDYKISPKGFAADPWKYQLVIHYGFDNEDIPEPWGREILEVGENINRDLRVFALGKDQYCAHCGLWYTNGETAYVEPVVTLPKDRHNGLAKAVIYEACKRAKELGAKRAVVLSDQEFYKKIGFEPSTEVNCWKK